jgi:dihydrofolate reductase
MPKVSMFNQVSLDGYFTDANGDMSWAHAQSDDEWTKFGEENASGGGAMLFGRKTYDMMKSFWPTPAAKETSPVIADGMNKMQKIVFSRTLTESTWQNTKMVKGDIAAEVRKLKEQEGQNITILGSGTIVSQLTRVGLIDDFQIVVVPIVLGKGRTLFEGIENRVGMKLIKSRAFKNGNVVLSYERT